MKKIIVILFLIIGFAVGYMLGPVPMADFGFFGRVADACGSNPMISQLASSECARQNQARLFNGIIGAVVGLGTGAGISKLTTSGKSASKNS